LVKAKKIFKKCSVKGCRRKAVKEGKCQLHSGQEVKHAVISKKLDDFPLRETASKIKKVRANGLHHMIAQRKNIGHHVEKHMSARHVSHPHRSKTECDSKKSCLSALSYWAGVSAGNVTEFFAQKKK
jgi:hypothetical protein